MDWASASATLIAAIVAIGGIALTPFVTFRHRQRLEQEALRSRVADLSRHIVQNWRVVDAIIAGRSSGAGAPLAMHLEKLKSAGPILDATAFTYLPIRDRGWAARLEHRVANMEVEIDEALLALAERRMSDFDAVAAHLLGTLKRLHNYCGSIEEAAALRAPSTPALRLERDQHDPKHIIYRHDDFR